MGRRIVVLGRIQGVGFRAFVKGLADQSGITGETWNRRDGGVEIVAYHDDDSVLFAFENRVRQGPGHVTQVNAEQIEIQDAPTDFQVSFSR